MKLFYKKEVKGAISLFLVAIMLPMFVLSALMVDTARYSLASSLVSSAGDLAMNGALADYDEILEDVYGLFAMSQADGDLEKNVKDYFKQTVVNYGVVGEEDAGSYVEELLGEIYKQFLVEDSEAANFLKMTVEDKNVSVKKVEGSSLANPKILEKQIVEFMKYRAPVDFGMSFFDSLSAFTKVEKQTDVVQAQVTTQKQLGQVSKDNYTTYASIRDYDKEYGSYANPDSPAAEGALSRKLEEYGKVMGTEYVSEYEKLHRFTMVYCSTAYLGKWHLFGAREGEYSSNSEFLVLNPNGDYIASVDVDKLEVKVHLKDHTTYSSTGDNLDSKLKSEYAAKKEAIKKAIQGYGEEKLSGISLSGDSTYEAIEGAVGAFQQVDQYYKKSLDSFRNNIKLLDDYACLMDTFNSKIDEEIKAAETAKRQAEIAISNAKEDEAALDVKNGEAINRLNKCKQEEKDAVLAYMDNETEIAELENSENKNTKEVKKKIQELKKANEKIKEEFDDDTKFQRIYDDYTFINTYEEQRAVYEEIILKNTPIVTSEEGKIEKKNEQKKARNKEFQDLLKECHPYTNRYNRDAIKYKEMKEAVEKVIDSKVSGISTEFKQMYNNLTSLKKAIDACQTNLNTLKQSIETYLKSVDDWSEKNETYVTNEQGGLPDGFAEIQGSEISKAENTYDLDDVKELLKEVERNQKLLDDFIKAIDANFSYMGSKKIKDITTAQHMADAIKANAAEWETIRTKYLTADSVTEAYCKSSFILPHNIEQDKLKELKQLTEPVPFCKFMNYLHQTYMERYANGNKDSSTLTEKEKDAKNLYETYEKEDGKSSSLTAEVEKKSASGYADKFGYTYQKEENTRVKEEGGNYPSGSSGGDDAKEKKSSLEDNKKQASGLLSGLDKAIENGINNLYVTAYLFDNFSYNTIVQDKVREEGTKNGSNLSWLNSDASLYADYVAQTDASGKVTKAKKGAAKNNSRNIPINSKNNKIYGAEIEYVLFGNNNPDTNVAYTQASIYAIRVVFNCIYAFTGSDIRNETRAVGLAVQAATLGFVPYQVVQVILQIALALGESAIDLENMKAGAKVAVIKSKDSWTLSLTGAKNLAVEGGKKLARTAANEAADLALQKVNELVDTGADKLGEAVKNLDTSLKQMASNAAGEVVNQLFAQVENLIDEKMDELANELFYATGVDFENIDIDAARQYVVNAFTKMVGELETAVTDKMDIFKKNNSKNPLVQTACSGVELAAANALSTFKNNVVSGINSCANVADLRKFVYQKVYNLKYDVSQELNGALTGLIEDATKELEDEVTQVSEEIKTQAAECTEEAKEKVIGKMNDFIDRNFTTNSSKMNTGALTNANNNAASSSAKGMNVMFGYSDYLKLFVFLGFCSGEKKSDEMICRMGDLIQINIANASKDSELYHRSGKKFQLSKAMTYVSLETNVELDMTFLNLGIFQNQVEAFNEDLEDDEQIDLGSKMKIHYLGLSGY